MNEWRVQIPTLFFIYVLGLNLLILNQSVQGNLPKPMLIRYEKESSLLDVCPFSECRICASV